jgi:hypothetical protein
MEKGDSLSLRAHARRVVDETNASIATAGEGVIEIGNDEADMMDARPAAIDESCDRRIGSVRLEELYQLGTGREAGDTGTIRIPEWMFIQSEEIAIEGKHLVDRTHGDSDVRDARSTTSGGWHENRAPFMV